MIGGLSNLSGNYGKIYSIGSTELNKLSMVKPLLFVRGQSFVINAQSMAY